VNEGEEIENGLSAFGANIEIAGTVYGGLEAFGANILVSGKNQGDMTFAGANVTLSGEFSQIVNGVAANLTISGIFEGDLLVRAARITIMPSALIKGDFAYVTALLERKEGSQILGKVVPLASAEGKSWKRIKHHYGEGPHFFAKSLFFFLSTIAMIIIGLFFNYFLPQHTEKIQSTISAGIWKNMGIGLIFLILVPLCVIIAFFTAVGIPAGVFLIFLYITMIYSSRVFVGLWVGRKIVKQIKEPLAASFFWPLLVGVILTGLLQLIPAMGWFFRLFFLLIGLGATWQVLWISAKPVKKDQTPINGGG